MDTGGDEGREPISGNLMEALNQTRNFSFLLLMESISNKFLSLNLRLHKAAIKTKVVSQWPNYVTAG